MTQHSLLLSQPLIPPTLRGDKTITRRTPSCTNSFVDGRRISGKAWKALGLDFTRYDIGRDEYGNTWFIIWSGSEERYVDVAPIYNQGDELWFKETYLKPPEITPKMLKDGADTWPKYDYMASCSEVEIEQYKEWGWKVKSSMFMPKAACRLWATVSEPVHCERLQDITEEQARREGVEPSFAYEVETPDGAQSYATYRAGFKRTWENLHGEDSWPANGPVYVIPFELVDIPEPEVMKEDVNTMGE